MIATEQTGAQWYVIQTLSNQEGKAKKYLDKFIPIEENVEGCARIINGDFDHLKKEDFYMIGKVPRI